MEPAPLDNTTVNKLKLARLLFHRAAEILVAMG
jgi:hypothetical protein